MNRYVQSIAAVALWTIAAIIFAAPAHAQVNANGSPCGMQYVNGQDLDYGPCTSNNNAPATPEPDLYTALAGSQKTGALGWSWRALSRSQAQTVALSSCRSSTLHPPDCRILDWAENECIGYVRSGNGAWAVSDGSNPFEAVNKALATCRRYGGTSCATVVVPCSEHPPQPLLPAANTMGGLRR